METIGSVCRVRPRCPPEELDPLLAHLAKNEPITARLQFPRGTLLEDGRLDLCKQALGPEGVRRVAAALSRNDQVAHLLLGADQLGPEGAMIVADLAKDHPSLETIYLGCNGIGPYGARALADALEENPRVNGLWLKRNAIGVEGARELARLLSRNDRIRTLDLVSNDLSAEGAEIVCRALEQHPLENLYLCGNRLGEEGAAAVAKLLRRNDSLLRIYLGTNELGDRGAELIAAAIRPGLIAMGLSSNGIGPHGASCLAAAIEGHPTLEVLELGFAPSTEAVAALPNRAGEGARAFAPVLARNAVLRELDLAGNGIDDPTAAALIAAVEPNRAITKLAIGDLTPGLKRKLNGILCRNANAARPRNDRHIEAIKSVYRTAKVASEVEETTSPKRPALTDGERGFTKEELDSCAKVLEALAIRREVLDDLPVVRSLMARVLRMSRPKSDKRKAKPDRALLDTTGIRRPALRPHTGPVIELGEARELARSRSCYVCKTAFTSLHHFYDSLCPTCAAFSWDKRTGSADLSGQVALLTGSRIKVGFHIALKLLRAGATVIATTRFPHDAAKRYAAQPDFASFADRLRIHSLDLLQLPLVETFARQLADREPRLDILINNAAQTLYRPPSFYAPMQALEAAELPPAWNRLIERPSQTEAALRVIDPIDDRLFPAGSDDGYGQPIDLRSQNSWRMRIHDVAIRELLSVNLVNAIAPYILIARLRGLMAKTPGDKFAINVSAVEGQFAKRHKTVFHPHTNMAKAALNMLTRTSAEDLANDRIYLTSVDPGWFSNENPHPIAEGMKAAGFTLPIDEIDGAARVLDPIFTRANGGEALYGCFLKDFHPTAW